MAALTGAGDLPPQVQHVDTRAHRLWGAPTGPMPPGQPGLQDPPGLHLWGRTAAEVAALPGHDRQLGLGLTEAMVRYAARQEWAVTVEDLLARRWRALFLNARTAQAMAPSVAAVLQAETGLDPQLAAFLQLSQNYQLNELFQPHDA
jgi:glycerol-3-phosphate dehydrogenase